jgi:transposase
MTKTHVRLSPPERRELKAKARSRRVRVDEARRADLILGLAAGKSYSALQRRLGCGRQYVARWKGRFLAERIAGLYSRHRGRKALRRTPALEGKILAATSVAPADGTTHWSTRRLARHLKVSHSMVARVWQRAGVQPHRMRRYMASDDPDFETKAADIIGLYHKPPAHAAVFSLDEKSAIQALDRLDPVLPLSPGRAERHGFEYFRHGTLSLYAALNTATGEVLGKTTARHTSAPVHCFFGRLARDPASATPGPPHPGQSFGSQNQSRRGLPGATSPPPPALHADLLLLAQPGRNLVLQNSARSYRPRRLYFQNQSGPKNHALHPPLQQKRPTYQVGLPRPIPSR